MSRTSWLPLLLLLACARVGDEGGVEPQGTDRATAQRIYAVAEERYEAGAYADAVELMRHALLQLPATPEHDVLRHQLVLRMAHTQLRDHAATGEAAPLHDAQQMLTRYLERHEELFGEDARARAQRGEVYELLFLVERGLEPPADEASEASEQALAEAAPARADASVPAEPTGLAAWAATVWDGLAGTEAPAVATAAPPSTTSDEPSAPAPHAMRTVDAEGNERRDVVVPKQRRLASLDDPRVVEQLRSRFSIPWGDLVLTKPGIELVHGPRALVRGTSRLAGHGDRQRHRLARRAGQSLVRGTREPLRGCYEAAFARQPIPETGSKVEASIHPDGSVSHVRIVDGGLVDGYGDACVIEVLDTASIEPLAEVAEPVRVQVALTFFYESAVYIVEGTGEQFHQGGQILRPNPKPADGLPPIESFVKPPGG